jgi:hypothetical protein
MKIQIGDLVQLSQQGLFQLDPYLVVEGCKYGNIKCRNLITGGEWTIHWKDVRPLTEENIEEARRSLEDRKKQMHEEMNNFLDKFK